VSSLVVYDIAADTSLLTLKLVISKLADMASNRDVKHVPYRDSKL
jgi:centromeric protein E